VLGSVLLFGPLVAVEYTMRQEIHWLRPVLREYPIAMDLKLLLAQHRDACPDLVTLGTSLTDRSLPPRVLVEHSLAGASINDPFNFAVAEVRATNMLAQYRWLRRRGCKPAWITVEVSPVVINAEHGGHTHDRALLDARTLLGMPDGFAKLRGYSIADQLEFVTYDRLLIHRRREQIGKRALNHHRAERWFLSKEQRAKTKKTRPMRRWPKLEYDGQLTGRHAKGSTATTWSAEQRRRRRDLKHNKYRWRLNDPEQQALEMLIREAASDGVGVIVHAPPTSRLYHEEISPKLGMIADFDLVRARFELLADELPNVVWYDAFTDRRYKLPEFADWIHLSSDGAKLYVAQLIEASNLALEAEQQARE
jgi:hypothetical protein